MKHLSVLVCLLHCSGLLFAQEKTLLLEAQLSTAGDVTLIGDSLSNRKGLTEESKKTAEGILKQWELPTGIKVLTLKEGRNKDISPLIMQLPMGYDAHLELLKGNLTLADLTGTIEAVTQSGKLTLKHLTARVRLYTNKGDIEVGESTLMGELVTGAGDITLTDVDGSYVPLTKEGTVSVSFSEAFLAKKQKETFEYGLPLGTIEAVGASGQVKFQLGQGSINVRKASFGVEALINKKGDIRLEEVGGKLRAITAQGSVFVQLLPQADAENEEPVWLEAQEGDITLAVPKDMTGFLTLDIAQTRDFEKAFTIESFLETEKSKSEEIISEKGEVLGRVYHHRQLIGGKQSKREIVIRVRNGNVLIKSL